MPTIQLSLIVLLATAAPAASAGSAMETARAFLDAYAAGDVAKLDRMVEPDVTVYGSDIAEIAHGRDELHKMLSNDLKLWGGPARIGAMTHVTNVGSGTLAALAFDAPFTLAEGKPVTVRFAMVLRRHGRGWRLAESSNATPTVGQSARELLSGEQ